jgi:hypothetical protein
MKVTTLKSPINPIVQEDRVSEREKRCYNKYLFPSFKAGKAYISPNIGLGNIQLFYCHK